MGMSLVVSSEIQQGKYSIEKKGHYLKKALSPRGKSRAPPSLSAHSSETLVAGGPLLFLLAFPEIIPFPHFLSACSVPGIVLRDGDNYEQDRRGPRPPRALCLGGRETAATRPLHSLSVMVQGYVRAIVCQVEELTISEIYFHPIQLALQTAVWMHTFKSLYSESTLQKLNKALPL